jgi:hypothetical protein
MSGRSAIASDVAEERDELPFDDDIARRANDEIRSDYEQRERREKDEADTRATLAGPHRAAVYRRLVTLSPLLTHAEVRFLCTLTYKWGRDLENCFPSRSTINAVLAGPRRKQKKQTLWRVDSLVRSCERKGFLQRVALTRSEAGELIEVEGSRFMSQVGFQFLLPDGVINPNATAWDGPRVWSNRLYGKRTR